MDKFYTKSQVPVESGPPVPSNRTLPVHREKREGGKHSAKGEKTPDRKNKNPGYRRKYPEGIQNANQGRLDAPDNQPLSNKESEERRKLNQKGVNKKKWRQQKDVQNLADKIKETAPIVPIPIPKHIIPHVVENRLQFGCIYPEGETIIIQGWEAFKFPVEYIDWMKKHIIKKNRRVKIVLESYTIKCDNLTKSEVKAIMWSYFVPLDFRGLEMNKLCRVDNAPQDSKQEIIASETNESINDLVSAVEEFEDKEEGLNHADKTQRILEFIASPIKDMPTVNFYMNLNNGYYYQSLGGVYYDYDGEAYRDFDLLFKQGIFEPLKIKNHVAALFAPIKVGIEALMLFKRPQPFPTVTVGPGVNTDILEQVRDMFKINVLVVNKAAPMYQDIQYLLLALVGKDSDLYHLLPGDALIPYTIFSSQDYTITWAHQFTTRHSYYPGGIYVHDLCGFKLFRNPDHKHISSKRRLLKQVDLSLVMLYPVPLEPSAWYKILFYLNLNLSTNFPTIGDFGWKWDLPQNSGLRIYRTTHLPEDALYVIHVVDSSLPDLLIFIPGYWLRMPILEVAVRNPDKNWMAQVLTSLSKLFTLTHLSQWMVQPLSVALYLDFHKRLGNGLHKHYYTFNPHLVSFTESKTQKNVTSKEQYEESVIAGRSWFSSGWNWQKLALLLLVFILFLSMTTLTTGVSLHLAKGDIFACADEVDLNHILVEETAKYFFPPLGVIFGLFELYVFGFVGLFNLIMHLTTLFVSFPTALLIHLAFNYTVHSWFLRFALVPAMMMNAIARFVEKIQNPFDIVIYGKTEMYLIPKEHYYGQLYDQKIVSSEKFSLETFIKPLQFCGADNAISSFNSLFEDPEKHFTIVIKDTVKTINNVVLNHDPSYFGGLRTKVKDRDFQYQRAGTVLYGMGYANLLPRRQHSLDLNNWTSLIEFRLKRVNTYDPIFKKKVWNQALYYTQHHPHILFDRNDFCFMYGLSDLGERYTLTVNPAADECRRLSMLKHFSGTKKKDYIDGYDKIFQKFLIKENWTKESWLENYSNFCSLATREFTTMSLSHKKDELLLKKGAIKPRPIFFLPITLRALLGPFLWAFKEQVYLNNYPFRFELEHKPEFFLGDNGFLSAIPWKRNVERTMLAMGASPLELCLWFTSVVINTSGSTNPEEWFKLQGLASDGSSYDLSGTSEDHECFASILVQNGVPIAIAKMIANVICKPHKVFVEEIYSVLSVQNIFCSGMVETTIFNTLRNISSSKITLDKFVPKAYFHIAGGDDYLSIFSEKLKPTAIKNIEKEFVADQLLMGVTSKVVIGTLPTLDFYSSLLVPARNSDSHIIVLTLKIGKMLKTGASHSELAHSNPWDILYETSYVWEKVTRHLPVANAIARFHKRLAFAKGGKPIPEYEFGNPLLNWKEPKTLDFYKNLEVSPYIDEYMFYRYALSPFDCLEFITFCESLPLHTCIVNHPVLAKIAAVDLE